ncbi:hypothetical protein EDD29_1500 [Actinocorallia herbida]|uniref:Uncharacterized protein n=1 Tax=Actinocorallia herbida TaxID=58109 RepID=A0A3N1CRP8_9ACTN|nr:hypothetical protein [Actinocorallia herbida]ROO83989.1 hypothetical protein EDD29_1500 [Actinocorallia herbida]
MSKERARRRAEREAAAAAAAERNRVRQVRRTRVRRAVGKVLPTGAAGAAARARRARFGAVVVFLVAVQGFAWGLGFGGMERFAVLVVSLLVVPVAAFLAFDRR